MPQLDTASYLPQVFSLVVVFFGFYLIVLKNILPSLGTILKVRSKKLSQGQDLIGDMAAENAQIAVEQDNILSKSLKESGDLLQNTTNDSSEWINSSLRTITSKSQDQKVVAMNKSYLKGVGEITAKKLYFVKSMN